MTQFTFAVAIAFTLGLLVGLTLQLASFPI